LEEEEEEEEGGVYFTVGSRIMVRKMKLGNKVPLLIQI